MMRIEQAIFTSVRGPRLDGYQFAGRSDGVNEEVVRTLTSWGPAHDSLLDETAAASSVNFHRLDDARFVLSKTVRQGEEYSGRGGGRILTQLFLLDRETLDRFANYPLAVLRALMAAGRTRVPEPIPSRLPTFRLVGRATGWQWDKGADPCDVQTLDMLASLVRSETPVAVVCPESCETWLRSLYARLSLDERLQLTFTTGLKPTVCRPFLLCVLPDEPALLRQIQRSGDMTVVHLGTRSVAQA